uniref:Uncharacterized protein n=1 Tax=Meloidogyne enterolobii TaxID=390850 RepID=A0A6V7WN00_MELEN|nr:unnamed protein product [Meloidogyne enterolobii]
MEKKDLSLEKSIFDLQKKIQTINFDAKNEIQEMKQDIQKIIENVKQLKAKNDENLKQKEFISRIHQNRIHQKISIKFFDN